MKTYKSFLLKEKINNIILLLEGSIEYSDSFVDTIERLDSKSKVANHLLKILGDDVDDKKLTQNFIDVTPEDDKVSFLSQSKFNQLMNKNDETDPFDVSGRNSAKIGRVVRSLCELTDKKFSDKEIEEFVNLYKAEFSSHGEEFSVISGDDIKHWYDGENYYESYGYGG